MQSGCHSFKINNLCHRLFIIADVSCLLGEFIKIVRPARLWPCAREALAAKRLTADNGADLVAVHIKITHVNGVFHRFDTALDTAVNAAGEAKALGVDRLDHAGQILRAKRGNMQDRAEHFLFKLSNRIEPQYGRRHKISALAFLPLKHQTAFFFGFFDIVQKVSLRWLINDRANVSEKMLRLAQNLQAGSAFEHGQNGVINIFLNVKHAQG